MKMLGREAYQCVGGDPLPLRPRQDLVCLSLRCLETLGDLQVRPMEVLHSCSAAVGPLGKPLERHGGEPRLGIAGWALATPMVLGAWVTRPVPEVQQ